MVKSEPQTVTLFEAILVFRAFYLKPKPKTLHNM